MGAGHKLGHEPELEGSFYQIRAFFHFLPKPKAKPNTKESNVHYFLFEPEETPTDTRCEALIQCYKNEITEYFHFKNKKINMKIRMNLISKYKDKYL